jgi:hypothetical protein
VSNLRNFANILLGATFFCNFSFLERKVNVKFLLKTKNKVSFLFKLTFLFRKEKLQKKLSHSICAEENA